MSTIKFTDKFTKSLAGLLLQYGEAPFVLKDENMKWYLENVIENGKYINQCVKEDYHQLSNPKLWIDFFQEGYLYEELLYENRISSYLCSIFMVLFMMTKELDDNNLYDLEKLHGMNVEVSAINTFISSLIMDFDFQKSGGLDFNSNYLPNQMVAEYIGNMYKTERMLHIYQTSSEKIVISFDNEITKLNQKIDKDVITTGLSFMQIQSILLLMESSNLYPDYIRKISKDIILIFKEILANARIKKIEIDSAIIAGVIRDGVKKTTGIKIFFALENFDRFCLRIDFPHEGADFLHLNLHEPFRETALPISKNQYDQLRNKYGELDEIFFHFGKLYWFRYNFVSKLENLSPPEDSEEYEEYLIFKQEMLDLFYDQGHYHLFSDEISKDNMIEFIVEFGIALLHSKVAAVSYTYTDVENINDELTKIKLRDVLSNALAIYQRCIIEEQFFKTSYNEALKKLKYSLIDVLFNHYNSYVSSLGTYEEFAMLDIKDILLLLDEICT